MTLRVFATALVGVCLIVGNAFADEWPSTFDEAFQSVAKQGCKKSERKDFIFFLCERKPAQYYFTKPGSPAYPGVLKRNFQIENGKTYLSTDAHSWGDDAGQPAFQTWMRRLGSGPPEVR